MGKNNGSGSKGKDVNIPSKPPFTAKEQVPPPKITGRD